MQSSPTTRPLTQRQIEILIGISSGKRYREVARALGLTEGSLKVYMSRLMSVTGKNRTELAVLGYELARKLQTPVHGDTQ